MKALGWILAASIAAFGQAPAAAAGPPPSEWVGQWQLDPDGPDKCVLKRNYTDGTRVESTRWPGGIHVLDVRNASWPEPIGGPYKLVSLRGGERLELDRRDSAPNGLRLLSGAGLGDRIAASDAIEVIRPDGSVLGRVDLSGIAAAAARLPGCLARTAKHPWIVVPPPMIAPPPPPQWERAGRRTRPLGDLATLFSAADYPEAAWQAGEEGRVGFLLLIGAAGRVESCSITSSSGSATLDAATCPLLVERARFEPARDHRGRPIV
ncbi:MAG TPA: TonB family protein, partial [Allosphingosinicella sp.]